MALPGVPQNVLDAEVDLQTTLAIAADGNVSPLAAAEAFWIQGPVDLSRWNKLFPYTLLVVRAIADGNGGVTYQTEPGWAYTFPIPPEGISFGMPFAINVQPTQGGIVEEHNGAPFRVIQLRGTTGFLPGRGRGVQNSNVGFSTALFGGTVAALNRAAADARNTVATGLGESPVNQNLHLFREFEITDRASGASAFVAKTTGYYQLRRLEYFLEAYVAEKKRRSGRDLRLALAIWKKEAVYLVTPQSFDYQKTGEGGGEEPFSLTFKAWKRVHLESGGFRPVVPAPVRRDPNALAQGLNTLIAARRTLQGLSKVADAVVGDVVRDVFEPLRQASLLTKDLMGVGKSIADMPDALARASKAAYIQLTGEQLGQQQAATMTDGTAKRARVQAGLAATETADFTARRSSNPGTTATRARAKAVSAHPASKPFDDPRASFELLDGVQINALKLPPAVRRQIEEESARVRRLRRKDFELMRDQVRRSADRLAIALGAGDATFEAQYGIDNVHRIKEEPTDSDWEALFALNDSCLYLDALAATADGEPSAQEETMEVMAALARGSGIAFKVPRSKFAVPFPYGGTLEELAKTYLGDPLRWHEIAALNGLREPYVDEVGFDLPLLVNGDDHEIVISDTSNLYVGQTVYVWSDQVRRTRRRVAGLRRVGASTVVTLNGDPDMGLYKVEDQARLSAFLPDTVNSQQLVYIPSDAEPIDDDAITKAIPGVNEFDPMVAASGVDLLLDSTNDLVITPDGDGRFAAGLANLLQYVRVALSVQRGHLLFHPDFGLPIAVGMSTADFDAPSVLNAVRRMFSEDPSIATINGVKVEKIGGRASITASITAAGTEQPVPLRFEVDPDFAEPGVSA